MLIGCSSGPRWLPRPYMVKILQKSPVPVDRFPLTFVCSTGDLGSSYFCSNYYPGMALTYFTARSIFCNLGFYIGECNNDGLLGNY